METAQSFPWTAVLEQASPYTIIIVLLYLLVDTMKKQEKVSLSIQSLADRVSTLLGAVSHELQEVRNTQQTITAKIEEENKNIAELRLAVRYAGSSTEQRGAT